MIPSKIKIESFAKRCHMGTLVGKGLKPLSNTSPIRILIFAFALKFYERSRIGLDWEKIHSSLKKIYKKRQLEWWHRYC